MSNYTKATNFATKDALTTGNPLKTLSGTELDDEFNSIATANATKANANNAALTGVPVAPTAASGTSTTQLATTAFVTEVDVLKAPLASPALTGTPTAPTAAADTSTTQLATTAFVATEANLKADLAGADFTGPITTTSTIDGRDVAADGVTADAALPRAGGAMTGPITTDSTIDGVDIATRDATLSSTTVTADAALPKTGGTMAGVIANFTSTGIDDNATSTAITIDANENVIVGKTAANSYNTVAGHELQSSGLITATRAGTPAILNRLSSDGDIALFRKDGTTVGSIGNDGTALTIGTVDTGFRFVDSVDSVSPFSVALGAATDGQMNLGRNVTRFKDAYLSGGVYLGGTGASNKLDDYEEGVLAALTITPETSGTLTANVAYDDFYYVKVGNLVTVTGGILVSGASSPVGTYIALPLPFTSAAIASGNYSGGGVQHEDAGTRSVIPFLIPNNSSTIRVYIDASTVTGSDEFYFNFSYRTA